MNFPHLLMDCYADLSFDYNYYYYGGVDFLVLLIGRDDYGYYYCYYYGSD